MATATSIRKSTPKPAKVAKLHRHDDGRVHALSSDGVTRYAIVNRPDGTWTCTCPAGRNGRTCYHVKTAQLRFPGYFPRPAAIIVPSDPEPEPPSPAAPARRVSVSDLYDLAA